MSTRSSIITEETNRRRLVQVLVVHVVVAGGSRISSVCRPCRERFVMLDYEIVANEGTQGLTITKLLFLS